MNRASNHHWTDERKAEAAKLWAQGWTAAQIARHLGRVSRNGVIGVLHRMGKSQRVEPAKPAHLPPKAPPVARNTKQGMAANLKRGRPVRVNAGNQVVAEPEQRPARASVSTSAWAPLTNSTPVPLMQAALRHCRWPIDIGNEPHFCGLAKTDDRYCRVHRLMSSGAGTHSERDAIRQAERVAA